MKTVFQIYSIILLIINSSLLHGQDFNKVATVGFVFLELPVSARYMALGETGITLKDYASEGVFVNPAIIALDDKMFSLNVSYSDWYVGTSHQAVGFSYHINGIGTLGLQGVYFDFGEMEKTRNQKTGKAPYLGMFSANAYVVGVSFAKSLTAQFTFGISVKYVKETIDQWYADNIIYDIGFIYDTGFHSMRIGASLQNFGLESKYIEDKFKMPQMLKMGISAEVWGDLETPNHTTIILEAAHPNDIEEHVQVGMENLIMDILALRLGYKFGYEFEDFTAGLGIQFKSSNILFNFDMAYMKHDYLNKTLRYTLSMGF